MIALSVGLLIPALAHLLLNVVAAFVPAVNAEDVDRITWGLALLTAAVLTGWLAHGSPLWAPPQRWINSRIVQIASIAATCFWLLSISWTQVLPNADPNGAWWGFGTPVALASIALVAIGLSLGLPRIYRRTRTILGPLGLAIVFVWYLPLVIQPPWGVFDNYHTRYVVNEVLGPLSGNFALGTLTPQYTTLLGIPLLVLKPVQGVVESLPYYAIAVTWLSLLAVLTVLLLVWATRLVLPAKLKALAPLLSIPLILISQSNPIGYGGPITSGFSQYPGRILGFATLALLLLVRLKNSNQVWNLWLGVAAGAVGINNFEFGLSSAVVLVFVLALSRTMSARTWTLFALGAACVPLAYFLLVFVSSGTLHPEYLAAFALGFGGGFGNIAMPVIGTWTALVGVFVLATSMGFWVLWTRTSVLLAPAALALFAGLSGLIHFGYYVGRSVTAGQLQILLAHLALIIAALVSVGATCKAWRHKTPQVAVLLLVCVLPIASIVSVRSPVEEWSRISPINKGASPLANDAELEAVAAAVRQAQQDFPGTQIGVAGEAGNYLELSTGATNVLRTNSPFDPVIVRSLQDPTCDDVENFDGIIVSHFLLGQLPNAYCGLEPEAYGETTSLLRKGLSEE